MLKSRMKKHIDEGKFTLVERILLCVATKLTMTQIRTWERNFARMDGARRKAFLAKVERTEEEKKDLQRKVQWVSGVVFNSDRACFQRFLEFDGAILRDVRFLEAFVNTETRMSTFVSYFDKKIQLRTIERQFIKAGAGEVRLETFERAKRAVRGAASALYFIRDKVKRSTNPTEASFKYGILPNGMEKRLLCEEEAAEEALLNELALIGRFS